MDARTVSSSRTVMSELMMPNDANFLGKVFGGKVMSLVDLCAYAAAAKFCGEVCVTAAIDRVDFREPIEVGDVVTVEGHVTYAGRTSMDVSLEVYAENPIRGDRRHTNTAVVTVVALRDGKPTPVPKLLCETREDKIRYLEGQARRRLHEAHRTEREAEFSSLQVANESELGERIEGSKL